MSGNEGDEFVNPFSSSSGSSDSISSQDNNAPSGGAEGGSGGNDNAVPEIQLLDWQIQQQQQGEDEASSFVDPFSSSSDSQRSRMPLKARTSTTLQRGDDNPSTSSLMYAKAVPLEQELPAPEDEKIQEPSTETTNHPGKPSSVQDSAWIADTTKPAGEGMSSSYTGRAGDSSTSGSRRQLTQAQHHHWQERYNELVEFVREHGHACVSAEQSTILFHCVKRQRAQKKQKERGQASALTDARESLLDRIGFVWDSREAVWNQRYAELIQFRNQNGHCNVPITFPPNPSLALWVKRQRRQYKLWQQGRTSGMNHERYDRLVRAGLVFEPNDPS